MPPAHAAAVLIQRLTVARRCAALLLLGATALIAGCDPVTAQMPTTAPTTAPAASNEAAQPTMQPTTQRADYEIAPRDLLRIEIWELQGPGKTSVIVKRVAESGTITMPYIGKPLAVAGLTEAELEHQLRLSYRNAQVLPHAIVTALVVQGSDGRHVPPGYFSNLGD